VNIFIAGSSLRRAEIHELYQQLYAAGHAGYDWTRDPGFDDPKKFDPITSAINDLHAVAEADALVWYVDGAVSHGAPYEAGYAAGKGIPVVVLWAKRHVDQNLIYANYTTFHAFSLEESLALIRHKVERIRDLEDTREILAAVGFPSLTDHFISAAIRMGASAPELAKRFVAGVREVV
jgi:hypothetical protein